MKRMRFSFLLLAAIAAGSTTGLFGQAVSQTDQSAMAMNLREGTEVPLKFAQDISSKTATEGDPVTFTLADNLTVNGVIVAKAGAMATGEVTNAKKAGMMGKGGELNVRLDHLKVGDYKVHLRGTKGREGAVALTVLFGPVGLIKHGKNIEVKAGTALVAYVADDIILPPAL
jgi:hypothetical protein